MAGALRRPWLHRFVIIAVVCVSVLSELKRGAGTRPEALAVLVPGGEALTRGGVQARVEVIGQALAAAGVRRDDIVAMVLPDGADLFLTFLGILSVAVCAPLNPASTRDELERFIGELRPRALVVASRDCAAAAVAAAMGIQLFVYAELGRGHRRGSSPAEARADDSALILFTSATTGEGKAVPITHGNLAAMAANGQDALALSENDRFLAMMPLFHLQGLLSALMQLLAGGSVVFTGGFAQDSFAGWMKTYEPAWYTAGPVLHSAILAAGRFEPGRLRFVRSIGARMAPELMAALEHSLGVPVLEGYGLTETGLVTANEPPPGRRKPGSVGRRFGAEIAILDESGAAASPGEEGEIAVRGASVIRGYRENEEATRRAFRDGWFLTGDLGRLDEDGFLFVTGRLKEMINRGGEKVLPAEVDDVLMAHPAVQQAAAFARAHPTLGEDVAAAVVLRSGLTVSEWELRSHAARLLGAYKVPRRIYFVDALPRGATGKVQRAELAGMCLARVEPSEPAHSETESRIAAIWRRVLNLEVAGIQDDFFELGGDSFAVTLMTAELEMEFGAAASALDTSAFLERPTITTLARLLGAGAATVRGGQKPIRQPFAVLQRKGERTAFFCLPGADENPYYFRELAQELGEDQPFYVVQDPRPMEDRGAYSVEDVASRFIEQIRTIQPQGPYLLGGHCFGGIVAFEMARQLAACGEPSGRLVMFEVPAPGYPKVLRNWRRYGQQAAAVLRGEVRIGLGDLVSHLGIVVRAGWKRLTGMGRNAAKRAGLERAAGILDGLSHPNKQAGRDYQLKSLAGAVTQFISAEEEHRAAVLDDPLLAWREFVHGEFAVRRTPGKADRIFRQPHVRALASQVRAVLDRSCAQPRRP